MNTTKHWCGIQELRTINQAGVSLHAPVTTLASTDTKWSLTSILFLGGYSQTIQNSKIWFNFIISPIIIHIVSQNAPNISIFKTQARALPQRIFP
jgi:hypothetical protein